jgi:hypothetical protein
MNLIHQSGERFLIDAGRGDAMAATGVPLARVYDRRTGRLFAAAPRDSVLARGYWEAVSVDERERRAVREEVAALLLQ